MVGVEHGRAVVDDGRHAIEVLGVHGDGGLDRWLVSSPPLAVPNRVKSWPLTDVEVAVLPSAGRLQRLFLVERCGATRWGR